MALQPCKNSPPASKQQIISSLNRLWPNPELDVYHILDLACTVKEVLFSVAIYSDRKLQQQVLIRLVLMLKVQAIMFGRTSAWCIYRVYLQI